MTSGRHGRPAARDRGGDGDRATKACGAGSGRRRRTGPRLPPRAGRRPARCQRRHGPPVGRLGAAAPSTARRWRGSCRTSRPRSRSWCSWPYTSVGVPPSEPGGAGMSLDAAVALRLGTLDLDVDLQIDRGEIVAVLGPNGAGKTDAVPGPRRTDPPTTRPGGSRRPGARRHRRRHPRRDGRPPHRGRVPGLPPVQPHDRARQRRLRPPSQGNSTPGGPGHGRGHARADGSRPARGQQTAGALGRTGPAP